MVTDTHLVNLRLVRACVLAIAASVLLGCQLRPSIFSAHSQRVGDEEIVQLSISSLDAKRIRNRELYFSVVVASCQEESEGYPMEPYIDGQRASDFKFATAGESVKIVGRIPAKVFDKYRRPCAHLRGGGYLTGTVESAPIPITSVGA
jgi:hypothetical protein